MRNNNVEKTKKLGVCVSCEACVLACSKNAIDMIFEDGQYLPYVDPDKCVQCGKCLDICPGIDINHKGILNLPFSKAELSGKCVSAYLAYSKNSEIRKNASSGGIITTLLSALMGHNECEGAFVLNNDGSEKRIARLSLAKTNNEIINAAKSKYIPVSIRGVLQELRQNPDKKYAIVGTSCQFLGIRKMLDDLKINKDSLLFLGLFCDQTFNYNVVDYFEENYRHGKEKLTKIDFRNKEKSGWPGDLMFHFDSSRKATVNRDKRRELKPFFGLERCVYCLDKLNREADISLGDCYVAGKENKKGRSSVLIRTPKGKEIFEKYSDLFELEEIDFEEIILSQKLEGKNEDYLMAKMFLKESDIPKDNILLHVDRKKIVSAKKNLEAVRRDINLGRKKKFLTIRINIFWRKIKHRLGLACRMLYRLTSISFIVLQDLFTVNRTRPVAEKVKKVLIFGANTKNKGAQAMLFTVINGINRKFNDVSFHVFSDFDYQKSSKEKDNYKFDILPWNPHIKLDLITGVNKNDPIHKKINFCLDEADLAIDISGYTLSSQWELIRPLNYIMNMIIFKKHKLPLYVFPQSIGPFEYPFWKKIFLWPLFFTYLKYPVKIFSREKEGENCLNKFTKKNVFSSLDIVFKSDGYALEEIYHEVPDLRKFQIETGSVGIIPNMKIFKHAIKNNDLLSIYEDIVKLLLDRNKRVYIFRHSKEDLEICKKIKRFFNEETRVVLIEDDLEVAELECLIAQLDFLIASRYHSIVHAYKHNKPAVVIGWATKYYELMKNFHQLDYFFDCRKKIIYLEILNGVDKIIEGCRVESENIARVNALNDTNPFDSF